uniref:Uncharacterized protein n=1 Tax=Oryza brachyantha TaxID=4533 RepID=J3LAL9_ORYBR
MDLAPRYDQITGTITKVSSVDSISKLALSISTLKPNRPTPTWYDGAEKPPAAAADAATGGHVLERGREGGRYLAAAAAAAAADGTLASSG